MSPLSSNDLRALVREVVREAVKDVTRGSAAAPPPPAAPKPPPPARTVADDIGVTPSGPLGAGERSRTDAVRITNDRDLDAFVRKLLVLFENPKTRADLKAGRLRFSLAGAVAALARNVAARRFDRGAVTEHMIAEVAASGAGVVLGPRAVLTPLAREKARALGVSIEKERR